MAGRYVKICGLRTADMVAVAVDAGADALGFIFAPGSARTVDAATVRGLVETVPDTVETVAVFRNQPLAVVLETARAAAVSTVQLHGDESLEDVRQVQAAGFRTLRAFSAQAFTALPASERAAWAGERVLLDAVEPGAGQTFDASVLADRTPEGFWLLAGGLNPGNVGALLDGSGAGGADVSSGVESSRGIKDAGLIRDFIRAARAVDA